jgi:uncharacterized membrane protein SirB2
MPYKAFVHIHETFATLYVLLFLIKLVALFSGNELTLSRIRRKTKILEMILPTLFLITGVYLAYTSRGYVGESWFITKLILLALAVVLGILTFKKKSRVLGVLTLLIFIYIIMLSYRKSIDLGKPATNDGAALFNSKCASCHGEAGNKPVPGAADLRASTLDDNAILTKINNGGDVMPAFKSTLSESQKAALVQYVKGLRK